jgi:predicted transcriptional regulator
MTSIFYFSNLVDRYKGTAILWCVLRTASGKQDFSMSTISNMLGVKEATIRKYLNNKTFFRGWYRMSKDSYRVYLVSIKKLKQDGYKLGTKFESLNTSIMPLVIESRLASTLQLQRAARKNEIKKQKLGKTGYKSLIKHDSLFDNDGQLLINRQGAMFYSVKSNIMFVDSTINVAGVTQKTIAKDISRCVATIRKSLAHTDKVRLYGFKPEYYMHHKEAQFLDNEEGTSNTKAFYKFKNYTFKALPTVYYPSMDLLGRY